MRYATRPAGAGKVAFVEVSAPNWGRSFASDLSCAGVSVTCSREGFVVPAAQARQALACLASSGWERI